MTNFRNFSGSCLVVCESMDAGDVNFKHLRRVLATCEGSTLYSKLLTARKDQCRSQTILTGARQIVMLSKFGQEITKIELENRRGAKNEEMEEHMKQFMDLMNTEVKQEEITCEAKLFFKTYTSFHLVTASDGLKSTHMLLSWILSRIGM